MNKKVKVVLDCDDVLYLCNETAVDELNKAFDTKYKLTDITKWGNMDSLLDERIRFFGNVNFVRNQKPYPKAREFVKKLSNMAEVFICTSVPSHCTAARIESIMENFPMIPASNIILSMRKDLVKADVILDDNPSNLVRSNCRYPVLFQKPWNADYCNGLLSVSSYQSFIELVKIITERKEETKSKVTVIVGPTGVGKKNYVKETFGGDDFVLIKTYTTANKDNHKRVSKKEFEKMQSCGLFFETSCYDGQLYGITKKQIDDVLTNGKHPVLVMDINGALKVRRSYKTKIIFIKNSKEHCILDILNRNISNEQKMRLIISLDNEFKNDVFCDELVDLEV